MIYKILDNNTLILTFDFGKGNSFSKKDMSELLELISEIEIDKNVKAVVLTGSNKSFSIGGNVEEIFSLKSSKEQEDFFRVMDLLLLKVFSIKKPIISAINGHAIGLGFLLMLCSDFTVSIGNDKIKFGLPEFTIGMTIDSLMIDILEFNNIKGKTLAKIIYSGELFGYKAGQEFGLIDLIVEEIDLISYTLIQIEKLLKYGTQTHSLNKLNIRRKTIEAMEESFKCKSYSIFNEILSDSQKFIHH
jgi:enoyl-CoA hydratase